MKTKRNPFTKKALSLLLTFVMVFGYVGLLSGVIGDPFGTAQTADAITSQSAGSYNVKFYVHVTNSMDNCCMYLRLYGRDYNGRASSESLIKEEHWNDKDTSDNTSYTIYEGTTTYFPTHIQLYLSKVKYYIDRAIAMQIYLQINGVTKVLTARCDSNSNCDISVAPGGPASFTWDTDYNVTAGKENSYNCNYYFDTSKNDANGNPQNYPSVSECTFGGPTEVTTTGETSKTYSVATVKDQYGVNWSFNSVTWATSNSDLAPIGNDGVAYFRDNNGKAYSTTFTASINESRGTFTNASDRAQTLNYAGGPVNVAVTPSLETLTLTNDQPLKVGKAGYSHAFNFKSSEAGWYVFFTNGGSTSTELAIYKKNGGAANNLGSSIGSNVNYGDNTTTETDSNKQKKAFDGARVASLLGANANQSYCVVKLDADTDYIVIGKLSSGSATDTTGNCRLRVRKMVNITFDGTGGAQGSNNSYTLPMPAGYTMKMNQTGFTRTNHTLLAWSLSNTEDEAKDCMASVTNKTIPSEDTSFYALWKPTAAPVLSPATGANNGNYTAAIDRAGEVEYYQFTPSTTGKYLIYGTSTADSYLVFNTKSAYESNATYSVTQNDATDSNGNTTGFNFNIANNQFFYLCELTAGTTYLFGVKFKGTDTGSVSFRFEPVYKVQYNANGGSNAPSAQDKFLDKSLTLRTGTPTRGDHYEFDGWGTSASDTTVDYAAGGTYTANANATLYAIWHKTITNRYYFYQNAEGQTLITPTPYLDKEGVAYNADTTANVASPDAQTSPAEGYAALEYTENYKTWTLKGWTEYTTDNTPVWIGATASIPSGAVSTSGSIAVSVTDILHNFKPVYALKTTVFFANFNYYTSNEDAFRKVKQTSDDVSGNAVTGTVSVVATDEYGSATTARQSYSYLGNYWSLVGWDIMTPEQYAQAGANAQYPLTGTPDISVNDATCTLSVPGATSGNTGDKHNTDNLTPVELYPVYELTGTSVNAHFHYYDKNAVDRFCEGTAVVRINQGETATSLSFPTAAAMIIDGVDYNTYTVKNAYDEDVTYTLVGWNYTDNTAAADSHEWYSVGNSGAYTPLGGAQTVGKHNDAAYDFYNFYPVYTCTTTSTYHFYKADGTQDANDLTTADLKYNTRIPTNTSVAILNPAAAVGDPAALPQGSAYSNTITLDGRTFTFVGWRKDTNSQINTITPADTANEAHRICDAPYHYYAVYANDQLTLSYCTTHAGIASDMTPADQVLSGISQIQYLNAGRTATTDNATAHTFTVNPADGTPLKTGYTFIGWDTTDNEVETCEFVNPGSTSAGAKTITIKKNTVLYAQFTVDTRNVTFVYYDKSVNGLTGGVVTGAPVTVSYDDHTRQDSVIENPNARYIATAPTVQKGAISEATIAHVNGTYHYVFNRWLRSDEAAPLKTVHKENTSGTAYVATFKNVTEDITVQAIYDSYRHHYVTMTAAELAQQDTDDPVPYKEATCTEDGWRWECCSVCGYARRLTIDKFDHKNSEGTEVVTYSGYKPSTCTLTGTYATAACALCNAQVKDENDHAQYYTYNAESAAFERVPWEVANATGTEGVIPALGHDYRDAQTVQPTCTDDGYVLKVCANDSSHTMKQYYGYEERPDLKKLGHDVVIASATDATCTEPGATEGQVCGRCHYVILESSVVPAKGHRLVKTASYKAPTCTEPGSIEYYTCSVCGARFKDKYGTQPVTGSVVLAALGHKEVEGAAQAPTCTAPGHTAGTYCERCGEPMTAQATDPALGHDWGENIEVTLTAAELVCGEPTGYIKRVCGRCGEEEIVSYLDNAEHVPETVLEKPATCLEAGHSGYTKCARCGEILEGENTVYAQLPHTETVLATATDATCTQPGHTVKKVCSECGTVLQESQEIPALGHSFSAWIVTTAATCTQTGEETRFCKRCGVTETGTVAVLGHKEKAVARIEPTCVSKGREAGKVCSVCGEVLEGCGEIEMLADHVMDTEHPVVVEATCTHKGSTTVKCVYFEYCGYSETEETDQLEHQFATVTDAIPATCDSNGWTAELKCSICGLVEKAEYEPRLEHIWQTVAATVTCTQAGISEYEVCVNCGRYRIEPQNVEALGHDWTAWSVVSSSTCVDAGSRTRTCNRCGITQTEAIEPSGHRIVSHAAKAPACGVKGRAAYYTCAVCGKTFSDAACTQECDLNDLTLDALEHEWVDKTTVAPTCKNVGYTEQECAFCNATRRAKEVGKTDHVEGVAATCSHKAKCAVCGQYYGNYNGNNHEGWTVVEEVASTCTSQGHIKYQCVSCPRTKTEKLPIAEHRTEITYDPAPSCTESGVFYEICQDCGKVVREGTEPAKGHLDRDGDGVCDRCGQDVNASSSTEEPGTVAPSGACDKCGRDHAGKTGGFFGYNGFICRLIAFIRNLTKMFKK